MPLPAVTVVIPNYNGAQLLQKNIPSVLAAMQQYEGDTTLVVVDDGSTDNSLQILKQAFPQAKVVVHTHNQGFADAIHSGVNAADTELLFLLNSDVAVSSHLLAPLVSYFDDPNTFAVNPLIYDERGEVKRHSWNLRQLKRGTLKLLNWKLETALKLATEGELLPTLYAHGGSFLVRKSRFLQLGGFHPIYKPFYSEDYDLGIRAWRMGWPSYFEPRVHIVHQSIGAIRSETKFSYIKSIRRRNRYILEWVHFETKQLLMFVLPASILQLMGECLTLNRVNLRGFYLAVMKLPEVMALRRTQKQAVFSLNDVLAKIKIVLDKAANKAL